MTDFSDSLNEAVELIVFGPGIDLPRRSSSILSQIYCRQIYCPGSFVCPIKLLPPLSPALRQYPRYAFPYIMPLLSGLNEEKTKKLVSLPLKWYNEITITLYTIRRYKL
jgi:hypothetical protein